MRRAACCRLNFYLSGAGRLAGVREFSRMSRFIDRLKRASSVGMPMGFRTVAAKTAKPRMLLVAAVAQADAARLAGITTGADAGLLALDTLTTAAEALKQAAKATPDIPWGGWLKEVGGEGVGKLGADFVVFNAGSHFFVEENTGKVLEVEPTLEPVLLKSADDLSVDAVLIIAGNEPISWRDLMLIQRCTNILNKPLLVLVPPEVTAAELGALSQAGVRGVVVKATVEGKITEIGKVLEKLPPPSARKRTGAGPLLPRIGGETGAAEEEEE
jgi:hypothetical protein